jgi:hypothetical protein
MILCPHCGEQMGVTCECRSWSRRKFFTGFGLALGGALLAPRIALKAFAQTEPEPAIVVPTFTTDADIAAMLAKVYKNFRITAFPILTPLLAGLRDEKPRSLFDPPRKEFSGSAVYWDVDLKYQPMPRVIRDYRAPRGSFSVFERFIEQHYAV